MRTLRILALAAVVSSLQAQHTTGRVAGTVSDPSERSVPGATVRLTSVSTASSRAFVTAEDGLYLFPAVPPGQYTLTVEAAGFQPRSASVTVSSSITATLDMRLAIAAQTDTVEATARTESPDNAFDALRSTTRTDEEVTRLPNLSRNVIPLVSLAPGVQPTFHPRGGALVTVSGAQAGQMAANGGRSKAAAQQLDYTDANDWEFGGFALGTQPPPDMLQEFNLLTANFPAEYGVKSNAQVVMITRSGTNSLHGSAYDFVQNSALNARDYFDRSGRPSPNRQNSYGFTAGGPLVRNRTFWFGGWQQTRTRGAGFTSLANVPTAAARARATDPLVRSLMEAYLPLPPAAGADPDLGTVASQFTSPADSGLALMRGDHRFSDAHSLALRYFRAGGDMVLRFPSFNTLPGFDSDFHYAAHNAAVTETAVFGPRVVNELRLGYGRSLADLAPQDNLLTPRFNIAGIAGFGALPFFPQGRTFNVYQASDTLTAVLGRHLLKAGFDGRWIQDNSVNASNARGVFTFASLDGFLAGRPASWMQLSGSTDRGFRTRLAGLFLQDDWKLRPSLTVNLGLRLEAQGTLTERHGLLSALDPALPEPIGAAGTGPLGGLHVGNPAVEGNPWNLGPRLGFAWSPGGGRLVLRGGYGIFHDSFTFTALGLGRYAPPLNYTFSLSGAQIAGDNGFARLAAGTAAVQAEASAQIGGFGSRTNFGAITTFDRRMPNAYAQHFSLGVQGPLAKGWLAEVSYVGTRGTHLLRYGSVNPLSRRPAPASTPADESARLAEFRSAFATASGPGNSRLDPRFDQVDYIEADSNSSYHSLQAVLHGSFAPGVNLRAFYTFGKSIDDSSDYNPVQNSFDNGFAQTGTDRSAERAVSNFDVRHRFILTGAWRLPWFRVQRGIAGRLLGGWSVETVNQWQSGLPATLLAGSRLGITDVNLDGNLIPTGSDNTRADCLGPGRYAQPLLGNAGTCGRNTLRMNPLSNLDWGFIKDTRLLEEGPAGSGPWVLQFRGELFNALNQPFLTATGDAWRTLSSPAFGQYNSAAAQRRVQLALRLLW